MNELCTKILKDVKQANPLKWVIHVNSASKEIDELFYWKDEMKQDIDCMILHIQTKLYNGLDELYGEMYNLFLEEDEEAAWAAKQPKMSLKLKKMTKYMMKYYLIFFK